MRLRTHAEGTRPVEPSLVRAAARLTLSGLSSLIRETARLQGPGLLRFLLPGPGPVGRFALASENLPHGHKSPPVTSVLQASCLGAHFSVTKPRPGSVTGASLLPLPSLGL